MLTFGSGSNVIIAIATGKTRTLGRFSHEIAASDQPIAYYASVCANLFTALVFWALTSKLASNAEQADATSRALDRIVGSARHSAD